MMAAIAAAIGHSTATIPSMTSLNVRWVGIGPGLKAKITAGNDNNVKIDDAINFLFILIVTNFHEYLTNCH